VSTRARQYFDVAAIPAASIVLALLVASVLIIASTATEKTGLDPARPLTAYFSLLQGAFGSDKGIMNTIVAGSPLVFTGLAVGIGFKAGLFNIGATGQVLVGGFGGAIAGAAVADQPVLIAVPVAVIAGALAGALYGFIPGALKAFTGAHEVVTTIMLNAIAAAAISGLVNDILKITGPTFARTADIGNAQLPVILGKNLHAGVLIAIAAVPITYWLIYRTTLGFEIRTVGANPSAARYAGMNPRFLTIFTMSLCGMFAGLAGVLEIVGRVGHYPAVFGTGIGFDGITVALLGRAHPFGILFAAILLGGMRAGAPLMQIKADTPIEIIDVIQAVILLFLAADIIARKLLRLRAARGGVEELKTVTQSYGQATR
jgi:simple sugar transport system permease protein